MKKKIVAIVVARQGSSRMPGKSMSEILNRPVVGHIIHRLKLMRLFDEICLATSDLDIDKSLIQLGQEMGVSTYGGHPEDVLDRIYCAAIKCRADVIVEVGGDCPFIDPEIVQKALSLYEENQADFVTNCDPQTYPDGMDVHVVRFTTLKYISENAIISSQRNHPFTYIHKHPAEFKIINFINDKNLSHLRWTLDYPEDFEFVSTVFEKLFSENELFTMNNILDLLERHPEIGKINQNRNLVHTESAIPAYWYTKAYIRDMLKDIQNLAEQSENLEEQDNFPKLVRYYTEIKELINELSERSKHFMQNK